MTPLVYPLVGESREPLIPVQLCAINGQPFQALVGLVDSGCNCTYLPMEMMAQLGIDEGMCSPHQFRGINEQVTTDGLRSTVEIPIVIGGYVMHCLPLFAPGPVQREPVILGMSDFFMHFDVCIQGQLVELRLWPSREMQFVGVHRTCEELAVELASRPRVPELPSELAADAAA